MFLFEGLEIHYKNCGH